jgi:SAM-dependent methyltransferase
VVVSARHQDRGEAEDRREPAPGPGSAAVWHDLECGSYAIDLPLWRELAGAPGAGTVLDVGAGTGRVALDLARRGHHVVAVDRDPELLRALGERAGGVHGGTVEAVCVDARALALERRDFGLCVVPMQTIQMFGGAEGRGEFLRSARSHLVAGGVLACAIVTEVDAFDCATGDLGPAPETVRVDGAVYISRPTRVHVGRRLVRIERERRVVTVEPAAEPNDGGPQPGAPARPAPPRAAVEHDVVELDRVSAAQLRHEGVRAGLRVLDTRPIPATSEHTGSVAVIFGV